MAVVFVKAFEHKSSIVWHECMFSSWLHMGTV